MNVLLHTCGALVLFGALRALTQSLWPSALAAAWFALHPAHVESVAWIAERKDVLSGLLFAAALWLHAGAARGGVAARRALPAVFALGLLAKPMLVTLPCVLLLLDVWPLGRLGAAAGVRGRLAALGGLVREKRWLLALAAAACGMTLWAQGAGGAVMGLGDFPLELRLRNALVAYVHYLRLLVWPADLAAYHPYVRDISWTAALGAGAALAALTTAALARPYLAVGWLWHAGMLVPVSGLVQVGGQSLAERYTYLPSIGLGIAFAWGAAELAQRSRGARLAAVGIAVAVTLALAVAARQQVELWRDPVALWARTVAVTGPNPVAHAQLALAELRAGRVEAALASYGEAVRLAPGWIDARGDLAALLAQSGHLGQAARHFSAALALDPRLRGRRDRVAYAVSVLADAGRGAEALEAFERALVLDPAWRRDSSLSRAATRMAWVRLGDADASLRSPVAAVRLAELAASAAARDLGALDALTAAYAAAGRLEAALAAAGRGRELAEREGREALAAGFRARERAYREALAARERRPRAR